jgi:hypothetical protein
MKMSLKISGKLDTTDAVSVESQTVLILHYMALSEKMPDSQQSFQTHLK